MTGDGSDRPMTWADERAELHAQLAADCGVEPTTIRDVFAQLGAAFGASTTTFPDDVDVGAIVRAAFRKDHERNWKAREARDAERVGRADDEG